MSFSATICEVIARRCLTASTDVAGACLAFAADHRRAFVDASERLAKIARAADERNFEVVLLDVELLVGRGEHFALVDVVDTQRLEHARLDEVADARFPPSPGW